MKFWTVALALVGLSAPAIAQDTPIKELEFEPDQVDGDLYMDPYDQYPGWEEEELHSLVKARPAFDLELIESVEEL